MNGKSYYNSGDGKVKAYSVERNAQIIIALLKANNIRKVIASPGATNVTFVGSIQNDPYFEIYSCVDERSAAYMACGLCESTGEPVVLSCTGATSSREYLPALSEAFKKNLPILVITSSQPNCRIGHLTAQVTDRRTTLNEAVLSSFRWFS
jgi:2-succinyl-5-enolpyruvyl-6-hydroxy-3-cyclohexene-1-carboxylate synthase